MHDEPDDARTASISRDDLEIICEATAARLQLRVPEARRVERMHQLLAAAAALARTLSAHTQHSMVDCHGSHGTGDLAGDTDSLFAAFASYAADLREIAAEYRALVREPAVPFDAPR